MHQTLHNCEVCTHLDLCPQNILLCICCENRLVCTLTASQPKESAGRVKERPLSSALIFCSFAVFAPKNASNHNNLVFLMYLNEITNF